MDFDDSLDLVFTRIVPVSPELIWRAWTEPALLLRWFTPAPWRTIEAEVDLRPGGIFRTVMLSPEGEQHRNLGCFLEVRPFTRLVWTDALAPGWRPTAKPFVTGVLDFEATTGGTIYTARVLHKDVEDRERHASMGFEDGWGRALDQLVALVRGL